MFSVRIGDAVKRAGRRAIFASTFDRVIAQAENKPVLVIVDLACSQAEPIRLIVELKRLGLDVVAFGAHVDVEQLKLAREAGANRVLPRSKFVEELGGIVAGPAE